MKLSIITCTYNSEKYLPETLASIINQGLNKNDFEHIFIDGESDDSTIGLIENYKIQTGYNIVILSRKKKGIYNAMNEGIKAASGDYILFLHSDDFLEKDILIDYLSFIEKTGNKDLYYAGKYHYQDSELTKKLPIGRIFYPFGMNKYLLGITTYVSQPTVLEKRETFIKYGYFDETYKIAADLKHYIELCGSISSRYYPKIVTNFRIHEMSASSGSSGDRVISELDSIYSRHFNKFFKSIFLFINKIYHA